MVPWNVGFPVALRLVTLSYHYQHMGTQDTDILGTDIRNQASVTNHGHLSQHGHQDLYLWYQQSLVNPYLPAKHQTGH